MNEAAAWVAKLDSGSVNGDDLKVLRAWAESSPRHREALERTAEVWDDLDVLAACRNLFEKPVVQRRNSWIAVAVAASLSVLAVSAWLFTDTFKPESTLLEQSVYRTRLGEQQKVPLPDGSQVQLNTQSRVEVEYTRQERTIRLQEGEAFFEVAKSSEQPFVVTTKHGTVTAIGTAFSIRLEADSMEVIVLEGKVRVNPESPGMTAQVDVDEVLEPAVLEMGQGTIIGDESKSVETLQPSEVDRALAWRDGLLIFEGDSLETVVTEVSRYTPVKIVISSPELRDLLIGGYFKTGETDALLATLESGFGVSVTRVSDDLVYLRGDG